VEWPTATPTLSPNKRTANPTERRPPVTEKPTRMPTMQPVTSNPTHSPTHSPTRALTYPPTSSPTRENNPIPDTPFQIVSALSSQNFCLYANNNYVARGTVMAIKECQSWNSFKWISDYEGKLRNLKNPDLCITIQGMRVQLDDCWDGKMQQMWIYNSNGKRLLPQVNGLKALTVAAGFAQEGNIVKSLNYQDWAEDSNTWNIQYDTAHMTTAGLLWVPQMNTFQIVSDLVGGQGNYCMYPANNAPVPQMRLAVYPCKSWKSFLWMWDSSGKLLNVKDPTLCIEAIGMQMKLMECSDRSVNQRFAYSVFENKLVSLRNGVKQAVVDADGWDSNYDNAFVRLSKDGRSLTSSQSLWYLQEY